MQVQVRNALESDKKQLIELVARFWAEHSRMLNGDTSLDYDAAKKEVHQYMENPQSGYHVAVDQESSTLIGFRRWEEHNDYYFTRELYVKKEKRRQGVAKKLISFFEAWVQEKGQTSACISFIPKNESMLKLARAMDYTILNTIEVRKNLGPEETEPKDTTKALGYTWNTY